MVTSEEERSAWEALSTEIRACTLCPLHRTRIQAVVYRGSLSPTVLFVGEAPGAAEDREGRPFVGASGRRLDAAIRDLGLTERDFGILNVIKCRPPQNRFDRAAEKACRPYLDRQLALLRPKVIVTLGASALRAFAPAAPPMLLAAGRPWSEPRWSVFPLLHPAATLRARRFRARWESDLTTLRAFLAHRTGESLLPGAR
jgi:uracil-DNA glycosylase